MGDPKRRRKQYATPTHPWQRERIEEERVLMSEYGLKNKREIWKINTLLRSFKSQAKKLIASSTLQSEKEKVQLIARLTQLGLIEGTAKLDDLLSIELDALFGRRLQTLVYKHKLARTITQARQFIIHGHIAVGEKVIAVPSYLVPSADESKIVFRPSSSLSSVDHPERVVVESKKEPKSESKGTDDTKKPKRKKTSDRKSPPKKAPKEASHAKGEPKQ